MPDTKISALTASTTPLTGAEVLPVVQSGVTKQVSVSNLTAGRSVSVAELTVSTGNLIVGTAGKGVDFSADPSAAGMTSELFDDYEEGTWTPASGVGSATANSGIYTKIGRQVMLVGTLTFPVQTNAALAKITGLPFTVAGNNAAGVIAFTDFGTSFFMFLPTAATEIQLYSTAAGAISYTQVSGKRVDFTAAYFV